MTKISTVVDVSNFETNNKSSRHITLIRPPIFSPRNSISSPITPPLGIAYLASSLLAAGHQVTAIDGLGDALHQIIVYDDPPYRVRGLTTDEIVNRIPAETDLIAVSVMYSQEWPFIRKILTTIKEKFPNTPMILGGEHVTALWEVVMETCPFVDLCALGEGEETIVDIARYFPDNSEKIAGIVYRAKDGQILKTKTRARIRNVDNIPRPAWHLFQMETYHCGMSGYNPLNKRCMLLLATRGCPYQCTFCSNKGMWTQAYITRSVPDVIDEIEHYYNRYKINHVDFADLTAVVRKDWIMEFGNALKEKKLNISWALPTGTRSEALDSDVLKLMAETNCKYIVYAAESGSARILKSIKKEVKLTNMVKSMTEAKRNGLKIRCNIMMGFPQETRRDLFKTFLFQMRLAWIGVDDATYTMFIPYPGSELFHYLRKTGKIPEINDEYYYSLNCQLDMTKSSTYCEQMGPKELAFYRLLGLLIFYAFYYLISPPRIFRTLRNIFITKQTETAFEKKMLEKFEIKERIKSTRVTTPASHKLLTSPVSLSQ